MQRFSLVTQYLKQSQFVCASYLYLQLLLYLKYSQFVFSFANYFHAVEGWFCRFCYLRNLLIHVLTWGRSLFRYSRKLSFGLYKVITLSV